MRITLELHKYHAERENFILEYEEVIVKAGNKVSYI